ncbi:MAG: 30S ribosomal protein S8 [Candidatus Moranbacteria bacterium]|nr:30S ribosomal protein S8 [Candidatus Moranbacteria bacterium]
MLDPISDMLTRIRNACQAGHPEVLMPSSKFKAAIADMLLNKKFIEKFAVEEKDGRKQIRIFLKYIRDEKGKKQPFIQDLQRVSREGQRIYAKKDKIQNVKSGFGFSIISTSKGLVTDSQARRTGIGGEIICEIW